MRRNVFTLAVVLLLGTSGYGQSYGVIFSSHEAALEKRTSIDISPGDSICFTRNFELGFDINYLPRRRTYFGYIVRIISNGDHNIDLMYDQKTHSFRVINGETFSNISFTIDSPRLYKDWNRIVLKFNLENQTLIFEVNGLLAGNCNIPLNFRCFKFLWGANDFPKYRTRDIPAMQIKDIKILENNNLRYYWPLNEVAGDVEYDVINRQPARIKNPTWIKPQHQKWALMNSFSLSGYAGVAFDSKAEKIYVTGSDSLAVIGLNNVHDVIEWVPQKHENLRVGNQAIFDTISNKLYDIFIDQRKVVGYDFSKRQWDDDFESGKITEFWHANKFISPVDSDLYVLGGYGLLRYKNMVQRYSFTTKKWEIINTSGDYSPPKYLSALGRDPKGNYVYIVGGYGSQTGDQMLDPGNFYDMFRYDVRARSFRKLYTLKPSENQFTFVNSLVVDPKKNEYYGLIFPNDSSNSNLQLIKGSLTDSSFVPLGNSIPFAFHDIECFADLYYSQSANKLLAVVLNYSKPDDARKATSVKIYSINFKPEANTIVVNNPGNGNRRNIIIVALMAAIAGATVIFLIAKRKTRTGKSGSAELKIPVLSKSPALLPVPGVPFIQNHVQKKIRSSIFLFGQFQVIDMEGHDITGLFTPLLKELFLIVSINSVRQGRGISSEMLNEKLWRDKSEKDAKNNRSVNIAKLKVILERIGDCAISKESGFWQFHVADGNIYFDFNHYTSIIQNVDVSTKENMRTLIDIIKRGAFLYQT
ncbi:MAG TPA: hypothetical protein VIL90_05395, partial [Puia sp.]